MEVILSRDRRRKALIMEVVVVEGGLYHQVDVANTVVNIIKIIIIIIINTIIMAINNNTPIRPHIIKLIRDSP